MTPVERRIMLSEPAVGVTPAEKLKIKLDTRLAVHGMRIVGDIDYPLGGQRSMDVCRWSAGIGINHMNDLPVWSIASWDTITACLRGFELDFRPARAEADIMVNAHGA